MSTPDGSTESGGRNAHQTLSTWRGSPLGGDQRTQTQLKNGCAACAAPRQGTQREFLCGKGRKKVETHLAKALAFFSSIERGRKVIAERGGDTKGLRARRERLAADAGYP